MKKVIILGSASCHILGQLSHFFITFQVIVTYRALTGVWPPLNPIPVKFGGVVK